MRHKDNISSLRHNDTSSVLLRHGDVIEYKCEAGFVPEGVATRYCTRAKIYPSFSDEPFRCFG